MSRRTDGPDVAASDEAPQLAALLAEWLWMRGAEDTSREALETLAWRVDSHRAELHAASARIQAERPPSDRASEVRIESNQLAIKACTTVLSEMTERAGHSLAGVGATDLHAGAALR